jgi:hypothetical protein
MTVIESGLRHRRPALQFANAGRNGQLTAARGSARSLDAMLVGVWEDLAAFRAAPCLVCGGVMAPKAGGAGGHCRDCGSSLS